MTAHRYSTRPDGYTWINSWGIPAGLVVLALVPIGVGFFRLVDVSRGDTIYAPYLPVVIHIVAVTVYCLIGAFQFSKKLRQTKPRWHRLSGSWVLPAGVFSAVSGLWLTQFSPNAPFDGQWVYIARLCGGLLMLVFLVTGISALRDREFRGHGRAMVRAYAIGIGAGTQVAFLGFIMEVIGYKQDPGLALGITAGWVLNLVVAEMSIRSPENPPREAEIDLR